MYRTAAKRLLCGTRYYNRNAGLRFRRPQMLVASSRFSTSESQPFSNPHSTNHHIPVETPNFSDSASSSSSSSTDEDSRSYETPRPGAKYQDEQTRMLQASLSHVVRTLIPFLFSTIFYALIKLGWTEAALIAGARDVGLSPSIVGSLPRKEAALVEFFMDDCLQRLIDRVDSDESLKNLTASDCIAKLVRFRLEMQAPYISKWPQALSIQAQPVNVPTSFKQRAMLLDEIWHAAGDNASDIDWYAKRTVLGGIYSTTEIYMLTDSSPDFRDTWAFLDARVKDAFDLKKTLQEAQYLAEAVSAGLGNSFQGFVGKVGNVGVAASPTAASNSKSKISAGIRKNRSMTLSASEIAGKLNLQPHPEGGFYAETFRDHSVHLSKSHLPPEYKVDRPVSTSIYFLLPSGSVSRLHRIPCAETWHHYIGDPITIVELNEKDGSVKFTCLGSDLSENQIPQYSVPPNVWFGSFPSKDFSVSGDGGFVKAPPRDGEVHYSLVGCTCAPAFQFQDFELAKRSYLITRFPQLENLITALTFPE
ncbi:Ubiquinone biosynthesis protein COQ9 [Sesbania bispinosa]|nr:Ubiquinone biosynthesis protein COQ9 [Sesbania bispinosa]